MFSLATVSLPFAKVYYCRMYHASGSQSVYRNRLLFLFRALSFPRGGRGGPRERDLCVCVCFRRVESPRSRSFGARSSKPRQDETRTRTEIIIPGFPNWLASYSRGEDGDPIVGRWIRERAKQRAFESTTFVAKLPELTARESRSPVHRSSSLFPEQFQRG